MVNFISNSDFTTLEKVYSGGENSTEFLNDIIEKYQKDLLIDILGEREYYNLDNDLVDGVPATNKWLLFVNGTDYVVDSVHYDYKGIKPVLLKFIYYYWQKENASILAESGELVNNQINARKVIPINKMVAAYNEGIDLIYNSRSYSPTVWHYLQNDGTFTDWVFTQREKLNTWGI